MNTKPIHLNEMQEQLLFQAAGRCAAATISKTVPPVMETELGDMAAIPVLGAFVSFKKQGELRSCMGCMAESMPLALAIEGSAVRAAKDDPRFAPISNRELMGLDMEVWVLWGMRPLTAKGKDRATEIEIGRHGLQISGLGRRGLLLPGVAIDHNMDVHTFLEAVCRKAGLPNDAWADDRIELCTFEGLVHKGQFSEVEITDPKTAAQLSPWITKGRYICQVPGPSTVEIRRLRDHCNRNFISVYQGMTAVLNLPGVFDGDVSGVALSLIMPDRPITICSKIALRAVLPLQSTMLELVEAFAGQLHSNGFGIKEVTAGRLELSVLWDPMVHGTAAGCDLTQVDPVRRAMALSLKDRWVVQYSPEIPPESMLEEAVKFLEVTDFSKAEVLSFETASTIPHLMASSISKPVLGDSVRKPAVAGTFYPSDPRELERMLDEMLSEGPALLEDIAESNRPKPAPLHPEGEKARGAQFGSGGRKKQAQHYAAAMVPHAGWIYSGRLAAQTFLATEIPERVVIFCPKHRPGGHDWAVAPHKTWDLPLRNVESDPVFAARMVDAVDQLQLDAEAHAEEHAIEVQLPILAKIAPGTKAIGVIIHSHNWGQIARSAAQFAAFLAKLERPPLLVISSDMNHYSSEEVTRKVDRIALDAIESLNPEKLFDTVMENRISMCGISPAVFVLETLKVMKKLNEYVPIGYTTSAARSGDTTRVVGYAGMLFR